MSPRSKISLKELNKLKKLSLNLIAAVLLIGGAVLPLAAKADTAQQVQWVGDVPIMPALSIEKGLGFAFDLPDGRIVLIYLRGDVGGDAVRSYYATALEPLGWVRQDTQTWLLEDEQLTITPVETATASLWKIALEPR